MDSRGGGGLSMRRCNFAGLRINSAEGARSRISVLAIPNTEVTQATGLKGPTSLCLGGGYIAVNHNAGVFVPARACFPVAAGDGGGGAHPVAGAEAGGEVAHRGMEPPHPVRGPAPQAEGVDHAEGHEPAGRGRRLARPKETQCAGRTAWSWLGGGVEPHRKLFCSPDERLNGAPLECRLIPGTDSTPLPPLQRSVIARSPPPGVVRPSMGLGNPAASPTRTPQGRGGRARAGPRTRWARPLGIPRGQRRSGKEATVFLSSFKTSGIGPRCAARGMSRGRTNRTTAVALGRARGGAGRMGPRPRVKSDGRPSRPKDIPPPPPWFRVAVIRHAKGGITGTTADPGSLRISTATQKGIISIIGGAGGIGSNRPLGSHSGDNREGIPTGAGTGPAAPRQVGWANWKKRHHVKKNQDV